MNETVMRNAASDGNVLEMSAVVHAPSSVSTVADMSL